MSKNIGTGGGRIVGDLERVAVAAEKRLLERTTTPVGEPRARAPNSGTETERRQFGTLRLRGAIWWIRYKVDGKCYEESSGSTDRRKAEKLLGRREAELGLGQFVAPNVKRTTLDDLAKLLRESYVAKGNRSLPRAEDAIGRLTDQFGGGARAEAVRDRVGEYEANRLAAGAARATVNYELAILRRMFRLGVKARRVRARLEIEIGEPRNARQGFFEERDVHALLAQLPERLRAPLEFAYLTGWRVPSEVLTRQWQHVDLRAGVVRLEPGETKNGEGRTFPFDVLPALKRLIEGQRKRVAAIEKAAGVIVPWVFPSPLDPTRHVRYFRRAWRSACRRAAVERRGGVGVVVRPHLLGRVPHDFRRTAVRNLVRAGVPESVAMKLTGHETRKVFERYNIVNERDLRDGVAKLAVLHQAQRAAAPRRGTSGGQ
jgi:integrase